MIGAISNSNVGKTEFSLDVNTEEFLNLFIAEMQNQDPLEPLSNSDMLSQLSQMTNIELMEDLGKSLGGLMEVNGVMVAGSMLGKTVTYGGENGPPQSAVVVDVRMDGNGGVMLGLANGEQTTLDQILLVML